MQSVRLFLSSFVSSCSANFRGRRIWLASLLAALTLPLHAQEGGTFGFTAPTFFAAERDGTTIITVTREVEHAPVAVDLIITDGTAVGGVDFTVPAQTNTLIFSNFQMTASLPITLVDNTTVNDPAGSKTATLTLANPRAITNQVLTLIPALDPQRSTAALEILDDDTPYEFNIERSHYVATEGSSIQIKVVISAPPGDEAENVEVDYEILTEEDFGTTAGSDFARPGDYEAMAGTLAFGPNDTEQTINVNISQDRLIEFNEDFHVVITEVRGIIPAEEPPPDDEEEIPGLAQAPAEPAEEIQFVAGPVSLAYVTILFDGTSANFQPAGSVDQEYNVENSRDTTPPFIRFPGANFPVYSMLAQPDGSSYIVGEFTSVNATKRGRIARILGDGMLDPTFLSEPGANDFVRTLDLYRNGPHAGKIIVVGGFTSINGVARGGVARLNSDGSVDTSFNPGTGADGPVYSVAIQPDGMILIGGDFLSYDGIPVGRYARLLEDGSLDATYDPGQGFDAAVYSILPDIVAPVMVSETVRDQDPFRFSTTANVGGNAGTISLNYHFFGETNDITVLQAGMVLYQSGLESHQINTITNQDGSTTDVTVPTSIVLPFSGNGNSLEFVVNDSGTNESRNFTFSAAIQANTSLGTVVGGDFTQFDGTEVGHVVRLHAGGALDENFTLQTGIGADSTIYSMARQSDGRVILGGAFYTFNSFESPGVARLNTDGSFDRDFAVGQGANDVVFDVAVQPLDDKILVAGSFTTFNSTRRVFLTRLLASGAVDTSFLDPAFNQYAGFPSDNWMFPEGFLYTVAIEPAGKILVGGDFSRVGGGSTRDDSRPRVNFARLHSGAGDDVNNPDPEAQTPAPGNFTFASETFGADENGTFLNILLERTNGNLGAGGVLLFTADGAAVSGEDYEGMEDAVIWEIAGPQQSDGEVTNFAVPIPILDDELIEGDEDFNATIVMPIGLVGLGGQLISTAPALGTFTEAKGIILENDIEPSFVTFSQPEYDFDENDKTVTIEVYRSGSVSRAASVRYRAQPTTDTNFVSATPLEDFRPTYLGTSGTVAFSSGQTNRTITLRIEDDNLVERDETLELQLFSPSPGLRIGTNQFGTNGISLVHIIDNDYEPGRVTFAAGAYSVREGQSVTVSVKRVGGNSGVLQVQYATADGSAVAPLDYNPAAGTLIWNDKESGPKEFTIATSENVLVDPDGTNTFEISLFNFNPSGAAGLRTNVTVSILDNDALGAFQFNAEEFLADEIGGSVLINVIRTEGSAQEAMVEFGTYDLTNVVAGVDYVSTNGVLTFAAGETSKFFAVQLMDNLIADPDRLIGLFLTNAAPEGATLGTITNAQINLRDNETINIPAGSVDTAFNTGSGANAPVHAVDVAADGKILLGGDFTIVNRQVRSHLARLNQDGTLDTAFGTEYTFDGAVRAIDVQDDGRILIGGFFTTINDLPFNRVTRFTTAGLPDTTFNPGSGADGNVYAIQGIDVDGQDKILIAGNFSVYNGASRVGIARINFDGRADPTFDPGTGVSGVVYAMAVQPDGKILIGGEFSAVDSVPRMNLARLNADGSLDTSFEIGEGVDGPVRAITIQYDGRIVIGGLFGSVNGIAQTRIARLDASGTLDSTYNTGSGANGPVLALALQLDGKVLAAGDFTQFDGLMANRIVRLSLDGTLDPTANFGLGANASINALAIQPNRQIVLGGAFTQFDEFPRNYFARVYGGAIDGPGELYFGSARFNVTEGSTNVVITVRRYGGLAGEVSAEYATEGLSASPGADYVDRSGVVTFAHGENFKTIDIPILDDTSVEPLETVSLRLFNEVGSLPLRIQPVAVLEIASDDSLIGFAEASYDVPENAPQARAQITLSREGETAIPLRVRFRTQNGTATAGQDYSPIDMEVVFNPGEDSKVVNISIFEDLNVEENETVNLQLEAITPAALIGRSTATLTILDNDFAPGFISLGEATSVSETNETISVQVNRVSGKTGTVTVQYRLLPVTAVLGEDYLLPASTTITFQEGETSKTLSIPLVNDERIEGSETFRVELFGAGGGAQIGNPSQVTLTITDDDVGPGSMDTSFNVGAGADGPVFDLELQPDGKIVLGGGFGAFNNFDFGGVVRLNPDGAIDPNFSPGGGTDGTVFDLDLRAANGSVIVAGDFTRFGAVNRRFVGRFLTNGFPDANLNRSAAENGPFSAVAVQADGKMIVGGDFTVPAGRIARLTLDGSLDVEFNPEGGANGPIQALAVQPDGRILVGGDFTRFAGRNYQSLVRLMPNGRIDFSFAIGSGVNGEVWAIEPLDDGTILIAGNFSSVNGVPRSSVARLNADGSVDAAFNPGAVNGTIFDVAMDQRFIYIGGDFSTVAGQPRQGVARFNRWGEFDAEFDAGSGPNGTVYALEIDSDGQLLIAGDFSRVNGISSPGVARLDGLIGSSPVQILISSVEVGASGAVSLTFRSEPGQDYHIQYSSDLREWNELTTIVASDFITTFTDESPAETAKFYRILRLEESNEQP